MATITITASVDKEPTKSTIALRPDPSKYLTIDGLIKDHAINDAQIPMIGYPASGVADYEIHNAKDVDMYVDAACWWYSDHGIQPANPALSKAPVVALLTPSCMDAIITFLALNRLGYAVLFLSTRLTPPAYVSLMQLADCVTIISPPRLNGVIAEMQILMECASTPQIESQDYRAAVGVAHFHRDCDSVKESKKTAWIIHSSGSTGFPKPIFISNLGCLANFRPDLGFRSFTVSPLFHSHALMEFGRALYAKKPIFFGNHALPVTRQNLLAALKVAQPEIICAVPYVLKLLGECEQGIAELAKAKVVMYGGSPCPDGLGDELVSKCVNLAGTYGATETGFIMNSFRPAGDKEWAYLRLHPPVAQHVLMDEISPGVFECVALEGLQSKDTSNSDDPPNSFRTRDLFVRHPDPQKSNYWKYLSRLDDRLTLVNGEKVLPLPIEGHIRKHQLVKEAVVFGFQRAVPGVVIFRSEYAKSLSDDDFLQAVWPQVETANRQAEAFSHIPRDLVVVMAHDKPYPATDKGTIIRAQFYEHFAAEIQAAYDHFEGGYTSNLTALSIPELQNFLLDKFQRELNVSLPDANTDVFSAGVDSLQSMRIWNIIKNTINLGDNGNKLSQNVVFECGTVTGLARHLYNLRLGIDENEDLEAAETASMQSLIDKYSTFSPHNPTNKPSISSFAVLLTGTTGTLCSFLLASLLKRPRISRVFSLVRADSHSSAHTRVIDSLRSRHLLDTLEAHEVAKFIALPSDLSLPSLGLLPGDLKNVLSSVTHIIHSAWAVNFNLPLLSFEPQHIRGVYNLLEHVALRTTHSKPAHFFFCSSISTASRTPKPAVIAESPIPELHHPQNTGYGRSKLVAERITISAALAAAMTGSRSQSRVLRIGQLAGDQINAVWNDTEAIALLIRSALPSSAGCIPSLDEQPSWLPVDYAARAIEEIAFPSDSDTMEPYYDSNPSLIYHILNPRTFSFTHELIPTLKAHPAMQRDFAVVSPQDWLDSLEKSDSDVTRNPSKKLLSFWQDKYSDKHEDDAVDRKDKMPLVFCTDKSVKAAPTLGQVQDPVSSGLMDRIVSNWVRKWEGVETEAR
ncbi:hypothetical protein DV736_g2175, partial [Chaetothyriales sp. CBS 134916]